MQFDYYFNNLGHMDADPIDNTQRTLQNARYADYIGSNFLSSITTDSHTTFATSQPMMTFSGTTTGKGLNGSIVDVDSQLLRAEEERPLDKVQLFQRAYLTVPYLGRGSCDPTLEHKLLQGENVSDMKSTSTIMDKSFMGYTMYPTDEKMDKHINNPSIEETALDGWVHGGKSTRITTDDPNATNGYRPTNRGF